MDTIPRQRCVLIRKWQIPRGPHTLNSSIRPDVAHRGNPPPCRWRQGNCRYWRASRWTSRLSRSQRLESADKVKQFFVDASLTQAMVSEVQPPKQFIDIFFGALHGGQAAGILAVLRVGRETASRTDIRLRMPTVPFPWWAGNPAATAFVPSVRDFRAGLDESEDIIDEQ